mgnify:CR=1 FL=1
MILPERVRHFIEEFAADVPFSELQKSVQQLSDHYRAGKNTAQLKLNPKAKTAAYLLTRLPATYAAAYAVVRALLGELVSDVGERVLLPGESPGDDHDISVISAPVYDHHHRQAMVVSLHVGRALTDAEITTRATSLVTSADALTEQLGGARP